jgi:hypothetical protein
MKISLRTGCCLFAQAQLFFPLLEINVEAALFVANDNAEHKRLMLTRKAMTGEQRSTDGDTLIVVVLSQNMRLPYSHFLDLTHRLQVSDDCCMVTTHLTGQFSSRLTGICVD